MGDLHFEPFLLTSIAVGGGWRAVVVVVVSQMSCMSLCPQLACANVA